MERFRLAALPLIFLFACLPAFPQIAGTGAIAGTVTDPSGAVVPEATITIKNEMTGQARTVKSTATGHYSAQLLPPGSYFVAASKSGFKEVRYPGISVHVTETQTVNITLPVGTISETLDVHSDAEQLQTETSGLGN